MHQSFSAAKKQLLVTAVKVKSYKLSTSAIYKKAEAANVKGKASPSLSRLHVFFSVFAWQRCRMNEDTGADYLIPWQLSECVDGGGVGVVESSHCSACTEGDVVTSFNWPWQTYGVMKGSVLDKV